MYRNDCEECNIQQASLYCQDCEQLFCPPCDALVHRNGTRRSHQRSEISESRFRQSDFPSLQDHQSSENLIKSQRRETVGIFWDLFGASLNLNFLQETAIELKTRYKDLSFIKVYGEQHYFLFTQLNSPQFDFRLNREKPEFSLILSDISSCSNDVNKIILISTRAHMFKAQLISLKIDLKVLNSPSEFNEVPIGQLKYYGKWRNCNENYTVKRRMAASESSFDISMISYLKDLAYEGVIMHEFSELKENIAYQLKVPVNYAAELIQTGCKLGKLFQQTKKIGNFEISVISLKIEKVTPKVLLWVLRSLKKDEMISTEKAVQSRMKEAFDLKFVSQTWTLFLEDALKNSHKRSNSQAFSFFSSQGEKTQKNFCFYLKKIKDFNSENSVIYPVNEEWISYDQYIKSGDVFQIKKTYEWRAFVDFFTNLYLSEYSEDKAVCGGRYGCAQYLKKQSKALKNSSLGKLSYIIQLAIDEDLLRYHKTMLVWSSAFDKKCKEDKQAIIKAKKTVAEAVATCSEGISLAQLPILLKERMLTENDLSNLGFAKLKDMVLQIPDLELTFKGKNHPFVKLRKMQKASAENVLGVVRKIVEKNGVVLIEDAELEIAENFGYRFKWSWVKVGCIEEILLRAEGLRMDGKFIIKKEEVCSTPSSCDEFSHHYRLNWDEACGEGLFKFKYIEDLLDDDDEKIC